MSANKDFDGIPEATDTEVSEFVTRTTENDQIGSVGVFTDKDTLKRYNDYMKDHRERMRSLYALQGEYMGKRRGRAGEYCG